MSIKFKIGHWKICGYKKHLIETALSYSRAAFLRDRIPQNTDISIEHLCSKIADVIYEHRIETSGKIRWINTRIMSVNVDKRYTYYMEMSDRYLYEGIIGMAVFSAAILKLNPDHQISKVYEPMIKELFEYTDKIANSNEKRFADGDFFWRKFYRLWISAFISDYKGFSIFRICSKALPDSGTEPEIRQSV